MIMAYRQRKATIQCLRKSEYHNRSVYDTCFKVKVTSIFRAHFTNETLKYKSPIMKQEMTLHFVKLQAQ